MKVLVINNLCLKGTKKHFKYIIKKLRKIYHNLIVVDFISFNNINLSKIKILIIAGGDGSINRIVNETNKYNIIYGIIPLGTANDFSHSLGIYSIEQAISKIRKGSVSYIPINKVNSDYFMYALSYGCLNKYLYISKSKKYFMKFAYVLSLVKIIKLDKETIEINTRKGVKIVKAKCVVITNSKYLGGFKINLLTPRKYYIFVIKELYDLFRLFTNSRKYLFEISDNESVYLRGGSGDVCLDGEKYFNQNLEINFSKKWLKMII